MKGLWLENNQLQLRTNIPIPEPLPGEALVRVLRAGICNTDLELIKGYYPYTGIIGHEFVGVVEQGPKQLINQRVVGEINAACGDCRFCRRGQPTHCENRTVLGIVNRHGAFAEYLSLPIENLHLVPENVSTAAATFTEPIAAALEIQQQIQICKDDRVLVVGRHKDKLVNLAAKGIKTGFADSVTDRYFDISVDCTGNPEGFNIARRALRPRGILILKSTYAGNLSLDASALVVDEITLIGSRCGPFVPALELLATGKIDVQSLIDSHYPLSQGLAAFEKAKTKGVLKVLLEMSS